LGVKLKLAAQRIQNLITATMSTETTTPSSNTVWDQWLRNTKTSINWTYNAEREYITTMIRKPWETKETHIIIRLENGGTMIEKIGNTIVSVVRIHVCDRTQNRVVPSIEDLLFIDDVEHIIYNMLPYPIYEEISQYRIYPGAARSIADIIEEYVSR
jgi:hypothetical protein